MTIYSLSSNYFVLLFFSYRETVTVYGNISLQNTSTAHASNVKVLYMLPDFVKFVSPLNYTHVQPIVSEDAKGLELLVCSKILTYFFFYIMFLRHNLALEKCI